MKVWIVSVGEPLPCDKDARLRRMGILADYLTENEKNYVRWFSVSFDHYKKIQRVSDDFEFDIKPNYKLNVLYTEGYKKNVSLKRIIHHKNAAKKIFKKMNLLDEKPDIIIASMEPLEISKIAVKYANINKIPIITDVRDLWPEIYYEVVPKPLHFLLYLYVKLCSLSLKYTMRNTTSIVGLSDGFLKYGLKYAGRDKTDLDLVIPIGYPDFKDEKVNDFQLILDKYNLKANDFIVIFLGNFGDQFNFDDIISAANSLSYKNDIKFILCGVGKQLDLLKEKTKNCNVIFTGWIDKNHILALSRVSKIGIAPYIDSMNYRLNTPNKFGEYLSYGLPILTSVSGEMLNLCNEYNCGYKYENSYDLTKIINELYNNPSSIDILSRNSRKLFEEKFDAEIVNNKFLNHINNIFKEKEK